MSLLATVRLTNIKKINTNREDLVTVYMAHCYTRKSHSSISNRAGNSPAKEFCVRLSCGRRPDCEICKSHHSLFNQSC
eukprot:364215-Chlamydomonas_euryale.AAC.3